MKRILSLIALFFCIVSMTFAGNENAAYTLSPANDKPVNMVDLWPIVVTFTDAKQVTLLDDMGEHGKATLTDPKGNEIYTMEATWVRNTWTAKDNTMTFDFNMSIRQQFTEAGEYTLSISKGSVILDGVPQDEMQIKYNVILPERPAEGPINLTFDNYVDEENRLFFTAPAEYEWYGSQAFYGDYIMDADGNKAGMSTNIHKVEGETNKWYITMRFDVEKNPKMTYTVNVNDGLLTLYDVYYVEHGTVGKTLTFYGSKEAAGVSNISVDAAQKTYYTIGGVQVANPEPGNIYIEKVGGKARKVLK